MCDPSYYVKGEPSFTSEFLTGYVLKAFLLFCIRPYSNKNFTMEAYNKIYEKAAKRMMAFYPGTNIATLICGYTVMTLGPRRNLCII